ncbi:hypothetical protein ACH5RR_039924 [Cinchona calisaya]|uniref:PGG domain-containing protein n=1 Tax=Cinchona calisaya TaxID=153742 RepID=A0ABD2Y251_9GENT
MDERLYNAMLKGDLSTFNQLIGEDSLLLGKAILNRKDKNPLHLATIMGNVDFIKEIFLHLNDSSTRDYMCLAGDRDGRNPLHLAAMFGKLEVLQVLIRMRNQAASQMCLAFYRDDRNPLHLAAMHGELEVLQVLIPNAVHHMCLARDRDGRNPLHLAAMFGKLEVLQVLIRIGDQLAFQMCLACDRDGRNPLHLAAMHGKLEVLRQLIGANFPAALQKTDGGGTILHLCVKYNQLEALKLIIDRIKDRAFLNAKNEDGMTVLHLAIYYGNKEAVVHIVEHSKIKVNSKDANEKTGFDLLLGQADIDPQVKSSLLKHEALRGTYVFKIKLQEWIEKRRDAIMVVASLIATMAFQAGISPPGGVWQDDLLDGPNPHKAGEALMALTHPKYFRVLIVSNTIAIVSSLSTIILLMGRSHFSSRHLVPLMSFAMLVAVTTIAITFAASLVSVAPRDARRQFRDTKPGEVVSISPRLNDLIIIKGWDCGSSSAVFLENFAL